MASVRELLTNRPNVVATITREPDLELLNADHQTALPEVLEFRLDNLSDHLDQVAETLDQLPGDVIRLVTVRCPSEYGANDLSDDRRLEIYETFSEYADLIDTEVNSLQQSSFNNFQPTNGKLIASFHDFDGFPGAHKLTNVVKAAYDCGADIAKVAVIVNEFSELNTLVEIVETAVADGKAISAMGMGPLGKISRLVLAKAGSCLNYGYFQTENAPGQWSAKQLSKLVQEI